MKITTTYISIGINDKGDGVVHFHKYFSTLRNNPKKRERIKEAMKQALKEMK
jgi:hypothetical protein